MNPTYDFTGQVALVTGAASGMGLATAKAFAHSGAAVALADRHEAALNAATEALRRKGYEALAITCGVTDEAQAAHMVDRKPRPQQGDLGKRCLPTASRGNLRMKACAPPVIRPMREGRPVES
jgi:hypothetical protein